jgi:hypothetical protein
MLVGFGSSPALARVSQQSAPQRIAAVGAQVHFTGSPAKWPLLDYAALDPMMTPKLKTFYEECERIFHEVMEGSSARHPDRLYERINRLPDISIRNDSSMSSMTVPGLTRSQWIEQPDQSVRRVSEITIAPASSGKKYRLISHELVHALHFSRWVLDKEAAQDEFSVAKNSIVDAVSSRFLLSSREGLKVLKKELAELERDFEPAERKHILEQLKFQMLSEAIAYRLQVSHAGWLKQKLNGIGSIGKAFEKTVPIINQALQELRGF